VFIVNLTTKERGSKMQTEIRTYVRGKDGQPIGMIAARRVGNKVYIAHCKANVVAGDKFTKAEANKRVDERMSIAIIEGNSEAFPSSMDREMDRIIARCYKYFRIIGKRLHLSIPEMQANTPKQVDCDPSL
jgi:hypothetical protein